ncbi:transcriptional regulator [Actinoplanes sp. NPDC051494]|uniref:transcriptional regulator n=1 Tax=Actinoplanes sp. NPDC051494 TaxID=3363907 RepID=UPI00379E4BFA
MRDSGDEFEFLRLSQEIRAAVTWRMQEMGMSRKDLAKAMNVTPGRISQMLSGDENLTLRTISTLASCLGTRAELMLTTVVAADRAREFQPGRA